METQQSHAVPKYQQMMGGLLDVVIEVMKQDETQGQAHAVVGILGRQPEAQPGEQDNQSGGKVYL